MEMESEAKSKKHGPVVLIGTLLGLLGFGLSLYSTIHHLEVKALGISDAACNISASINCDDVARSEYAEIMGIPLGVFGMGYFLGLALLLCVAWFKEEYEEDNLRTYWVLAAAGVVASLILGGISVLKVGVICPTCIGVYLTCIALLALAIIYFKQLPSGFAWKSLSNGLTYPIVTSAFVAIAFSFVKPTPQNFTRDDPQFDSLVANTDRGATLSPIVNNISIAKTAFSGLGEDYRAGGEDAKVIITEFADFECPACRGAHDTLRRLKNDFGQKILVVFRNYPLDNSCNPHMQGSLHKFACEAAVMSRCAGRYGKFWKMHDTIFDNQGDINSENLAIWAKEVGLNQEQIFECKESQDILNKIKEDIAAGQKAGVQGTPALYINGRSVVNGRDYSALRERITTLLNE